MIARFIAPPNRAFTSDPTWQYFLPEAKAPTFDCQGLLCSCRRLHHQWFKLLAMSMGGTQNAWGIPTRTYTPFQMAHI